MAHDKNYIISVDQLHARYLKDQVVIVDCRFSLADIAMGERLFLQDHIATARYLHLDRDMSGDKSNHGGRHPLPDPEKFSGRLRDIGVNNDSLIVCYDDQRFAFASRLWWLMRWLGHENVVVLDGGYKAWKDAHLPVESGQCVLQSNGNFQPQINPALMVDRCAIVDRENSGKTVLVDSREQPRYSGEMEPIDPIAGHIPGAINKPWPEITNTDGFAVDVETQKNHWKNIEAAENVVVYCGSGVTACVNLLSLAMVGRDDVKLYAGSWSDWCSYIV